MGDTLPETPRLRRDLAFCEQRAADAPCTIVKDPRSGNFYRFRAAERFIGDQLDGETPLERVRERAEAHFGAALSAESLRAFVGRLDDAGLLERDGPEPSPRRRSRLNGGVLHLRFKLVDPDAALAWLAPRLGFLFTPAFLGAAAVAILAASAVTVADWPALRSGVRGLVHLRSVPMFVGVTFLIASAHELAHGMACKRFGGAVHEIGVLLIYFQPACYCDVSDAWLFADKRKRLAVAFAGPFFELFLWALATLAWAYTGPGSPANRFLLTTLAVTGVKTLVNLSPFIKLDGYYMLSDWLELPNLRSASFRYLGNRIRRRVGRPLAIPEDEASPRVRRILLAYALVVLVPSLALLAFVAAKAVREWTQSQSLVTAILVAAAVGLALRRRWRKLFRPRIGRVRAQEAEP